MIPGASCSSREGGLGNIQTSDERQQQDSVGTQATQPYGTATHANPTIDFSTKSGMPSIVDLATAGLRRLPRIASKQSEMNHSGLS